MKKLIVSLAIIGSAICPAMAADAQPSQDAYYSGIEEYLDYAAQKPPKPAGNDLFQDTLNAMYPRPPINKGKYKFPLVNFGIVKTTFEPEKKFIFEKAFRGGVLRLDEMNYKFLKTLGINSVISIEVNSTDDQALCAKYNLTCKAFSKLPLESVSWTNSSDFQEAFKFAAEELDANRKIYIHCLAGNDRTSMFAAAISIRALACDEEVLEGDKKIQVMKAVDASIDDFRGWRTFFPAWFEEAYSWVNDFQTHKEWLCAK